MYGFAKSDMANISGKDLRKFKDEAKDKFLLTDKHIEAMLKMGTLKEII